VYLFHFVFISVLEQALTAGLENALSDCDALIEQVDQRKKKIEQEVAKVKKVCAFVFCMS
jgi:hypothetical protein